MTPNKPSDQSGETLLQTTNLSCVRGDRLLFSDLGFTAATGELVHITGPNGSGKTTLFRVLCNLTWPESGEVRWREQRIGKSEQFKHESIYIGHQNSLKSELSVLENLKFYGDCLGAEGHDPIGALERLQLDHCQHLLTARLSAGQRRRTALARLLLAHRVLWILDEPFTSLDADGRELIEDLLEEHINNAGVVILASHESLISTKLRDRRREISLS